MYSEWRILWYIWKANPAKEHQVNDCVKTYVTEAQGLVSKAQSTTGSTTCPLTNATPHVRAHWRYPHTCLKMQTNSCSNPIPTLKGLWNSATKVFLAGITPGQYDGWVFLDSQLRNCDNKCVAISHPTSGLLLQQPEGTQRLNQSRVLSAMPPFKLFGLIFGDLKVL